MILCHIRVVHRLLQRLGFAQDGEGIAGEGDVFRRRILGGLTDDDFLQSAFDYILSSTSVSWVGGKSANATYWFSTCFVDHGGE